MINLCENVKLGKGAVPEGLGCPEVRQTSVPQTPQAVRLTNTEVNSKTTGILVPSLKTRTLPPHFLHVQMIEL
jgi:hypothetical protein